MGGYFVHPERYSLTGVKLRKRGVVIHTSEGGETADSDQHLIAFMAQPGDRVVSGSDPPRRYGASYQAVADGDAQDWIEGPPATHGTYSAAGANKDFWHIVMPGKAAKTRAQWLTGRPRGQIKAVAKFIVAKSRVDGFPLVRLTPAQLVAGQDGYCGHVDISRAFDLSDHTDPGVGFPWDVLAADIAELLAPTPPTPTPPEVLDMFVIDWKLGTPDWTALVCNGPHLGHIVSTQALAVYLAAGAKRQNVSDAQLLGVIRSTAQTTPPPPTLTADMADAWNND